MDSITPGSTSAAVEDSGTPCKAWLHYRDDERQATPLASQLLARFFRFR